MNHRHRKLLHALFAHPASANIPMDGVEAVLGELGAVIESNHGGKAHVRLNGRTFVLHPHNHDLSPDEVRAIRGFLVDCGIDPPTQYPL